MKTGMTKKQVIEHQAIKIAELEVLVERLRTAVASQLYEQSGGCSSTLRVVAAGMGINDSNAFEDGAQWVRPFLRYSWLSIYNLVHDSHIGHHGVSYQPGPIPCVRCSRSQRYARHWRTCPARHAVTSYCVGYNSGDDY